MVTHDQQPPRPEVILVRHGETAWTLTGQHTSRTDVPLTPVGRVQAQQLGARLASREFDLVLSSPLQRAIETCRLAGFGGVAQSCSDLKEWDYGTYEGRTTSEIRMERPGWSLWDEGSPDGETAAEVAARADRVVSRLRRRTQRAILFSHGHFLRVLAARWVGLGPSDGRRFALGPASISALSWEREEPVVAWWNEAVAGDR